MVRTRRRADPENRERWLISYADFLTLLLALFLFMFASSQPDIRKAELVSSSVKQALREGRDLTEDKAKTRASNAPDQINSNDETPELNVAPGELMPSVEYFQKVLGREIAAGKVSVHLEARGLVISLRQATFFPSGDDVIAPSGLDTIEKISNIIRFIPNPVRFEGHTDSVPIQRYKRNQRFRTNWELSAARSIALLEFVARRYDILESRFAAVGYADTRPVDSNASVEGRSHNRRVDVVILSQPTP
jgi:chemotaxis protein MotB